MNFTNELTPNNIGDVLQRLGIDYNGRSDKEGWTTIHSPLREDKNPSFGLNAETGAWKDFSTGEAGDIVTLTMNMNNMSTKEAINWIKEETDVAGALYNPPKQTQKKSFWDREKIEWIKEANQRIKSEPDHILLNTAKNYDCLEPSTLLKYGCGVVEKWGSDWLAFPYSTGCQLYKRDEGKNIRSVKGSSPGDTFFGMKQTSGNDVLFIAKSPREAMLLDQLTDSSYCDVIGLCTGEQGNISHKQIEALRSEISASKYDKIFVLLDCDTETAYQTAKSFSSELDEALESKSDIRIVNIHESTGTYKDITECIRAGMDRNDFSTLIETAKSFKVSKVAPVNNDIDEDDIFDVSTAPSIPMEVYDNLPKIIQERCSLIEQRHRKDVFLIASLPVMASHLTKVVAGHADGYYSPDLFTLIVADPGAGKGVASKAKKLGNSLNKYLIERSKQEKENFESLPNDDKILISEPKDRSLFIPANSSSRAIYDTMEANSGWGLLFETEIDTMLNATGQEWGNFSDITRKAFHHEDISINRKNDRFFIDNPRLSICITGTFDQFKKMFNSAENGHFSRYALYTFDVPRKWQSHRPTENSIKLDQSIESASEKLFRLHQALQRRTDHLYIDLTDQQWELLDSTFAENMQAIEDLDLSSYLHASNNRAAILALRMASMFAVIRLFEENPIQVEQVKSISPNNSDMKAAIMLADVFIKHAIRLYNILPNATNTDGKGERYNKFLKALETEFQTSNALDEANRLGIPEGTVKRWLSDNNDIQRIKHGLYRKVSN